VRAKERNVAGVAEKDEPFGRGVWVGFTFKSRSKVDQTEILGYDPSRKRLCSPASEGESAQEAAEGDEQEELLNIW